MEKDQCKKMAYVAPVVSAASCLIEMGFAGSGSILEPTAHPQLEDWRLDSHSDISGFFGDAITQ
ncbi:MAG: hypothetical protein MJZ99_01260 [Bacteroidales bacterium]|nr:hypothetical protein [Bacteroidales bacterium]